MDAQKAKALLAVLTELVGPTGATGAFVIDRLGHLVAGAGTPSPFTVKDLGAWVAGTYSTVERMTKELGEDIPCALPVTGGETSGYMFHLDDKAALVFLASPGRKGWGKWLLAPTKKLPKLCALLGKPANDLHVRSQKSRSGRLGVSRAFGQ